MKSFFNAFKKTSGSSSSPGEFLRRSVDLWSVQDVCDWLDKKELGEYKKKFKAENINGQTLLELKKDELSDLGISSLGHKKLLMREIQQMNSRLYFVPEVNAMNTVDLNAPVVDLGDLSDTGSQLSNKSDAETSSTGASSNKSFGNIKVKAYLNSEVYIHQIPRSCNVKEFYGILNADYGFPVSASFKDEDGDLIRIRKTSDWEECVDSLTSKSIKLWLVQVEEKESSIKSGDEVNEILTAEEKKIEDNPNVICVISESGNVIGWNKKATQVFGYERGYIKGRNVKVLMPEQFAANHDKYLKHYRKTGEKKIIDKGRDVRCIRSDGTHFVSHLTVKESTEWEGHNRVFVGEFLTLQKKDDASSNMLYSVLETLLDCIIVINNQGIIQFSNSKSVELTGYSTVELLGQNIRILMPSPFKEHHNGFLKRYRETREAHVMDSTREVVLKKKDGSLLSCNLSLSKNGEPGDSELWIGTLRPNLKEIEEDVFDIANEKESMNSLIIPVCIIDDKGTILVFNDALLKFFGYNADELLGKNVKILAPEPHHSAHDGYLSRYADTHEAHIIGTGRELSAKLKDGSQVDVSLSVTERFDKDGKKYYTGMFLPR